MKPLLAGELTDPTILAFPVYTSPKLDGIRALVIGGQLVSRTLKPIPNDFIRRSLSKPEYDGFDGEIVAGETFQETTSAVMSRDGEPRFTFHVFDDFTMPDRPFQERQEALGKRIASTILGLQLVEHRVCSDEACLQLHHQENKAKGYEGSMIRSPDGIYKFGRSTEREGILLKMKDFKDDEAVVVGFEELMHNGNEAKKDATGKTVRGASKKNLVPAETLGALILSHPTFGEFRLGTGFSAKLRKYIWDYQDDYLGQLAKFRYQPEGVKDKPRIPSFIGFRDPIDL